METTYEARVAAAIAQHAPKLSTQEAVAVAAIREYLKLKLRGANLHAAMSVLEGGVTNANDTVFIEHARPREDWLYMFVASMGTLLADRRQNERVLAVFKAIGVEG